MQARGEGSAGGDGRLGVIAGSGRLPAEAARRLAADGRPPLVFGFEGLTDPDVAPAAHRMRLGRLEQLVERLSGAAVERLLLVGGFPRSLLLAGPEADRVPFEPDAEALALLAGTPQRDDEGLMGVLADWLEARGFALCRQDVLLCEMLVGEGAWVGEPPDDGARREIETGRRVLRALGGLGLGQSVALRDGHVLAVEVAEGTDAMIARAGALGGPGLCLVKAPRPDQDRRLDLPTIGPGTIEALARVGARRLAVEAGSTLAVDADRLRAAAEAAGIAVWGFPADSESA